MNRSLKLVFMGTPAFAVPSLDILVQHGYPIAGVITAPDRPAGRGLQVRPGPVRQYAQSRDIPVFQPVNLKNPDFLESLKSLNADLQVVVAFRMLPEVVWGMPPLGTINLHASWLPDYRGAAPINWAIINGEQETGLTTFRLRRQVDTGNIIFREKIRIAVSESAGQLHDRMMQSGANLLLKTVDALKSGDYPEIPQDEPGSSLNLHLAPKLSRETGRISWNEPSVKIINLIRGLSPYPGAWTVFNGKTLKILQADVSQDPEIPEPGKVWTDHRSLLKFAAADGWISVKDLQLEGKKRMDTADFLKGYRGPGISGGN